MTDGVADILAAQTTMAQTGQYDAWLGNKVTAFCLAVTAISSSSSWLNVVIVASFGGFVFTY